MGTAAGPTTRSAPVPLRPYLPSSRCVLWFLEHTSVSVPRASALLPFCPGFPHDSLPLGLCSHVTSSSASPDRAERGDIFSCPPRMPESLVPASSCFVFLPGPRHPLPVVHPPPSLQGPGLCRALLTLCAWHSERLGVGAWLSVASDCRHFSCPWGCMVLSLWFYFVCLKTIPKEVIIANIETVPCCSEFPFSRDRVFSPRLLVYMCSAVSPASLTPCLLSRASVPLAGKLLPDSSRRGGRLCHRSSVRDLTGAFR